MLVDTDMHQETLGEVLESPSGSILHLAEKRDCGNVEYDQSGRWANIEEWPSDNFERKEVMGKLSALPIGQGRTKLAFLVCSSISSRLSFLLLTNS